MDIMINKFDIAKAKAVYKKPNDCFYKTSHSLYFNIHQITEFTLIFGTNLFDEKK